VFVLLALFTARLWLFLRQEQLGQRLPQQRQQLLLRTRHRPELMLRVVGGGCMSLIEHGEAKTTREFTCARMKVVVSTNTKIVETEKYVELGGLVTKSP
jgi:hypothetical protein